jgi:hypothetical protein
MMEQREPNLSSRVARQRDIERLSDAELRHLYERLMADIAASTDHPQDEIYLVGAELSRREYQAFRRAALGRHALESCTPDRPSAAEYRMSACGG